MCICSCLIDFINLQMIFETSAIKDCPNTQSKFKNLDHSNDAHTHSTLQKTCIEVTIELSHECAQCHFMRVQCMQGVCLLHVGTIRIICCLSVAVRASPQKMDLLEFK